MPPANAVFVQVCSYRNVGENPLGPNLTGERAQILARSGQRLENSDLTHLHFAFALP